MALRRLVAGRALAENFTPEQLRSLLAASQAAKQGAVNPPAPVDGKGIVQINSETPLVDKLSSEERKSQYSQIRRDSAKLSKEDFAILSATKGTHARRKKLLERYLASNGNLQDALQYYNTVQQTDTERQKKDWLPFTEAELRIKWGDEVAKLIMKDCEDRKQVEQVPGIASAKIYSVYNGAALKQAKKRDQIEGLSFMAGVDKGSGDLLPMLGDDLSKKFSKSEMKCFALVDTDGPGGKNRRKGPKSKKRMRPIRMSRRTLSH